jgi:hypothetical protein
MMSSGSRMAGDSWRAPQAAQFCITSVHEQVSHANCVFPLSFDFLPPDLKLLPILMRKLELIPPISPWPRDTVRRDDAHSSIAKPFFSGRPPNWQILGIAPSHPPQSAQGEIVTFRRRLNKLVYIWIYSAGRYGYAIKHEVTTRICSTIWDLSVGSIASTVQFFLTLSYVPTLSVI